MEHEINQALFKADDTESRKKCIVIMRDIEDISAVLGKQDLKLASKFIDMIDADVDYEAQKMLDNLKQKLNREIPKYHFLKLRVKIFFFFLEFARIQIISSFIFISIGMK